MSLMVRLSFLMILAALFSVQPACAQSADSRMMEQTPTVGAIRVDGAQRIEPTTVLSYISLKAGDPLTDDNIDKTIKSLYATGFFSDVQLLLDGSDVIIKIEENPIINRLAFEGNDEIKKEDLEKETQLKPRTVYTRARVQADVDRILNLYHRSGRYAATVEPKIVKLEQNRVDLVFEISEGKQTGIEHISFTGNKAFTASELREVLATRETRWWRVFSSSDYYDPDRVNFDRELLRRHYLNSGYADFRVLSSNAELSPDKSDFFMNFTIEEGERYKLGAIDLTTNIKDFNAETLRDQIVGKTGDWYNAQYVEKTISNLTNAAGDLQYAFVDIQPDIKRNKDTQTIDITYKINEGARVFIHQVNVKGNTRTLDKVIRRELLLAEGDPYNASKIKQSEQRIKDLGFFGTVKIDVAKTNEADQSDLNVNVEEKSTGEVSVGAGYSTNDGILGDFSIRERNFLGKGQNVKLSATLSQRTQQYDFSFTEPAFLDRDLAAGFDVFRVQTDNQDSSSYDQDNTGFDLRLGYPLGEKLRQKLTYTLEQTDITNVPVTASRFIREQEGQSTTSSVGQELSYDARDSKLNPTKGYVLRLSNDLAGLGGSISYLRTRTGGDFYYPIIEDVIFNVDGEVGYVTGLEGKDVRISDRFFLGGDTLRGFDFGGIGPRDLTGGTNDALGGNRFYRASTELSFPVGLPEELGIKGHTFVDAGSLGGLDLKALPGEDIRDAESVRVSAGLGMSWQSPFGPIRIDYAFPLKYESYDQLQRFRFSFGTSF